MQSGVKLLIHNMIWFSNCESVTITKLVIEFGRESFVRKMAEENHINADVAGIVDVVTDGNASDIVMSCWLCVCTLCELLWLQLMQSNMKMADVMASTTKVHYLLYYLHNLV